MSKRDTIEQALLALTRRRSSVRAFEGWDVVEPINLKQTDEMIPYELCGTRFRRGAWVTHPRHEPKIAVGGTCIKALLLGEFPERGVETPRKSDCAGEIRRAYAGALDPGSWIRWVVDHAPRSLAREAAELNVFKMTRTVSGLRRLIEFHDATRKYPAKALILDYEYLPDDMKRRRYLTIQQARREVERLNSSSIRQRIADENVVKHIAENELRWRSVDPRPWDNLDDAGKRVVAALDALASFTDERPLCPEELARQWPHLSLHVRDVFCWHPRVGVAHIDPVSGEFWLSHSGKYKAVPGRDLWRSVAGAPAESVSSLVCLAFAVPVRLAIDPSSLPVSGDVDGGGQP